MSSSSKKEVFNTIPDNDAERNFPDSAPSSIPIKYTIENSQYLYQTPSRGESKAVDSKMAVPKTVLKSNDGSSPKSLLDFDKPKENGTVDDQHDLSEDYAADKEDNRMMRRGCSFKQTQLQFQDSWKVNNLDCIQSEIGESKYRSDLDITLLDYSSGLKSPPKIKRKRTQGIALSSKVTEDQPECDTTLDTPVLSNEFSLNKGLEHGIATESVHEAIEENENHFSQQPFTQHRQWNPQSGFYPSTSYDTSLSGYGSLDYSSEEQSNDTPKMSNVSAQPRVLKNGRICRSSATFSEQLPLVPEIPSMNSLDNSTDAESCSLLHQTLSTPEKTPRLKSIKKRKFSRQATITEQLNGVRGVRQQTSCKDCFFAVLFYFQIAATCYLAYQLGPQAFGYSGKFDDTSIEAGDAIFTHRNFLILTFGSGIVTLWVSLIFLVTMTVCTRIIVPVTLFVTMASALLGSLIGTMLSSQSLIPVIGLVLFGASVAYTFTVWDYVSFVTAQLSLALSVIEDNVVFISLACLMQFIALLGIMLYLCTFVGICHYFEDKVIEMAANWKLCIWIGMGISFIWTFKVLENILKATTSGIAEHLWFVDRKSDGEAILQIFVRIITFSFGSICLGSLFIGPAQFLRHVATYIRPNKEEAALKAFVIVQDIIVSLIDLFCTKFNNWAFSYVGIYGYGYFQAGDMAQKLFQKRGWQEIVSIDLLDNVLFGVSLVVGGLVGLVTVFIENATNARLFSFFSPSINAFMIGFIVGVVQSNMLFMVITSTAETIMICFAGSPDKFERRYPLKCMEFRRSWRDSWPGTIDFVSDDELHTKRQSMNGRIVKSPGVGPSHLLGSSRSNLDDIFV